MSQAEKRRQKKALIRGAEIIEEHAEGFARGCRSDGEEFVCSDCPAGRATCKREHAEWTRAARQLRRMAGQ